MCWLRSSEEEEEEEEEEGPNKRNPPPLVGQGNPLCGMPHAVVELHRLLTRVRADSPNTMRTVQSHHNMYMYMLVLCVMSHDIT